MNGVDNIYMPSGAEIVEVRPITRDVSLYTLKAEKEFRFRAGQFFMLSVPGRGEVPISVASTPEEPLRFCIRSVGHVTAAIHRLGAGDRLGIRGPYGNGFPTEMLDGKDAIIMAGGLGIVPLRPLIYEALNKAKKVYILFGSKTPSGIIYGDEVAFWSEGGADVYLTVDFKDDKWEGRVGAVTGLLDNVKAVFSKAVSFVCGPDAMIKASMRELSKRGVPDEGIIATVEAHMKCGVGKCGHCYMGPKFVCTDGPVFSLAEMKGMPLF